MAILQNNPPDAVESSRSAVSWGAILAGSAVAAAVTLLLALLGAGLGFAAVSPFSASMATLGTLAVSALIWFVVVQWLASALGGYVTGRLRTKWVGLHTDEVFFRDTAHGLVTWCVSTLLVAALLAFAAIGAASTAARTVTAIASGAAEGAVAAAGVAPTDYLVDTLFRPAGDSLPATPAPETSADVRAEAGRILANGIATGEWPDPDKAYLSQIVAGQTGLTPEAARQRIDQVLAQIDTAKQQGLEAAETARKAAMTTALLGGLALVIGAFIAAVSAALAGSMRDEDVPRTI